VKKNDIMIVVIVAAVLTVGFFVWQGWQEAHDEKAQQEQTLSVG
jgi:predicted negative regulator of RcsB-dependent stress response